MSFPRVSWRVYLAAAALVLAPSLASASVVQYNFETNNGTAVTNGQTATQFDDASGNGHNATNDLTSPSTATYSSSHPTGGGSFSIDYNNHGAGLNGYFDAAPSSAFATALGGNLQSFTISFQLNWADFSFGGAQRLAAIVDDKSGPDYTSGLRGWAIAAANNGGRSGINSIEFDTAQTQGGPLGKTVLDGNVPTPPDYAWHDVAINVDGSAGLDTVAVTMSIDGTQVAGNAAMPRPLYNNYRLYLFNGGKNGNIYLDNFAITSAVPEPTSLGLLALGGLLLITTRRKAGAH